MKALAWRGLTAAILLAASPWASPGELSSRERLEDFDAMTRALAAGYAYFQRAGPAWRRARASVRPRGACGHERGIHRGARVRLPSCMTARHASAPEHFAA